MTKSEINWFLKVLAVYGLVFGIHFSLRRAMNTVSVEALKPSYYHHEIVRFRVKARRRSIVKDWLKEPPRLVIFKDGRIVPTVGGMMAVDLRWNEASQAWEGRWPCPWNAENARYQPVLMGVGDSIRIVSKSFSIINRVPAPAPKNFAVLTFENLSPLTSMKVRGPDGAMTDWKGLADWAEHMGVDAFWMLASSTPGTEKGDVWVNYNLSMLPLLGKELHKRNIRFGVWVMGYLTSKNKFLDRYEYALTFEDRGMVKTRAISLKEEQRITDLGDMLLRLSKIPEVDYVGIDYIRNALGGYELAQDFYREMPGARPPQGWEALSREAQQVYFFRKKVLRQDRHFIDQWQWWRAHKAARIVERVKSRIGGRKPLWVFTLAWEMGWHHGQDPVMMNDAGADIDAVMMYEATRSQYDYMLKQWNAYVAKHNVQLIVGNIIDWPLHQRVLDPPGPKEFVRRMQLAIDGIYSDGRARGIFIHDLGRALWGRLGPYSTREWVDAGKESIRYLRRPPSRSFGDPDASE
ncbi:MAG: hypothetical protein HY611_05130, partial [Elusimicrobia bacterium]|nr:hypothetical protein [Elusimicrobiota bacterium]